MLSDVILSLVFNENNQGLFTIPTDSKVHTAIFYMDPCNSPSPDGFPVFLSLSLAYYQV